MSQPFLLYHWSPRRNRSSILRRGLRIRKKSPGGSWRPPYLCWSKFPNAAWALSATHGPKMEVWDLWCAWSDRIGKVKRCQFYPEGRRSEWTAEYRSFENVPAKRTWLVGTRLFRSRRHK